MLWRRSAEKSVLRGMFFIVFIVSLFFPDFVLEQKAKPSFFCFFFMLGL